MTTDSDRPRAGVFRLLGRPTLIAAALAEDGWRTALIDPVDTLDGFWDQVAAGLGLPAYFGRNLDALWDCLTDLDGPTALVLADWTVLARARPDAWAALLEVFEERAAQQPAFAVALA